ncbi:hypothetical protein BDN70DRAFT_871513 [Pholiota conissans]|uniref:Uncharacterized protein n=1 Tax=Pholiota conissans TaxID=109636 RepID=A0A9P5ZDH3_9AGAR|nr:hypothetical protein BDN70DRAFT_871513 [Pholiota conissans]
MTIDFKRNVHHLLPPATIIRLRGMSSRNIPFASCDRERPPENGIPISVFCLSLQDHFASKDDVKHVEECIVEELFLYKEPSLSAHELVAARVRQLHGSVPSSDSHIVQDSDTFYIYIERLMGKTTNAENSSPSLANIPVFGSSSLKERYADDVIGSVPHLPRTQGDTLCSRLTFTEAQPLHLHQLVVLATMVHNNNPIYCLTEENCYFFASSIFEILRRTYESASLEVYNTLAGSWYGSRIYGMQITPAAIDWYHRSLIEFMKPIQEKVEQRRAEIDAIYQQHDVEKSAIMQRKDIVIEEKGAELEEMKAELEESKAALEGKDAVIEKLLKLLEGVESFQPESGI